ncbi:helix-turn-helix transcriptional regulator [Paracoccus jiaweipingae]|uniref:helix-turn-helix transcriptional regulator n=1 Tax=unclassified Paracoccus (in: a-proteobacteria) TaxID=2688777 RepID=UPI0037A7FFE0
MQSGGLIDPELAADLLAAPDAAQFSTRLLAAAQSATGVDEVFAYRLRDGAGMPEPVASSSELGDAGDRVRLYARRFFRRDPAADARQAAAPGSGFHIRIAAGAIAAGDYRRLCFDRPRFTEKICFGWRGRDDALIVSFYQRRTDGPDLMQLGALAQIAITGLTRLARPQPADPLPQLQRRLAARWPVLTPREVQVCARTLTGEPAHASAQALGLAPGTVLTYRQRAYQKLGISRASDLLGDLL